MGRFLTDVAHFAHCVPVAGSVELRRRGGERDDAGAAAGAGDATRATRWAFVVDQVARMLESLGSASASEGGGVIERLQGAGAARRPSCTSHWRGAPAIAAFDPEPVGAADSARWVDAVAAR